MVQVLPSDFSVTLQLITNLFSSFVKMPASILLQPRKPSYSQMMVQKWQIRVIYTIKKIIKAKYLECFWSSLNQLTLMTNFNTVLFFNKNIKGLQWKKKFFYFMKQSSINFGSPESTSLDCWFTSVSLKADIVPSWRQASFIIRKVKSPEK